MAALQRLQAETKLAERKELPKAVDGVSVSWKEKESATAGLIPVLTLLCLCLLYTSMVQELAAMERRMDSNQTLEAAVQDFAERSGLSEAETFAAVSYTHLIPPMGPRW